MDLHEFTDEQKEYARNYLENDGFNLKNNLKYQLKTVAPRHILIIDLVYFNMFVYLLAINVNARKAYAIPSPLIKFQSNNSYIVREKGHKETSNVIKMFKQLLKQTSIKMVICDQELAFLSKEFKNLCMNQGITIHNYIMNRIEGINPKDNTRNSSAIHGLLSILDRLVRTLRNMTYNIGIINQDYNIETNVRVMNESNSFDKLKHNLLPGIFTIVGRDNNLFICKQGNTLIKVPRYMLKPV